MTAMRSMPNYTFDAELEMKDSYAVAATAAAAQVDSTDKIADVGDAIFSGVLVIEVTAIDIASNDEVYTITVQGSNSSSFANTIENLAGLNLGATEVRLGGAQDSVIGRYLLPFVNCQRLTATTLDTYRYLRVYTTASVAGSTITYTAFIGKTRAA